MGRDVTPSACAILPCLGQLLPPRGSVFPTLQAAQLEKEELERWERAVAQEVTIRPLVPPPPQQAGPLLLAAEDL